MKYELIVQEIMDQCYDEWCFNKEKKQYTGYFDAHGCLCILKKHFHESTTHAADFETVREALLLVGCRCWGEDHTCRMHLALDALKRLEGR